MFSEPRPDFPDLSRLLTRLGRALPFFLALSVYALFGSPTPDQFGWVESLIAFLLLLSIAIPRPDVMSWSSGILLFYGLSVPLVAGAVAGHAPATMARDLIAFIFLLLPLFFAHSLKRNPGLVLAMVSAVGVVFAVRSIMPYAGETLNPAIWFGQPPRDLLYLANSPEVLFSAIFLMGTGMHLLWAGRNRVLGICLSVLSLIPVLSMSIMMQRAGIGCFIFSLIVLGAIGAWRNPARVIPPFLVLCLISAPLLGLAADVLFHLAYKTHLVGLNSRYQEWVAVIEQVSRSPAALLFGLGWGAIFENPAVGNLEVNYTHSLFSALLLKTGLFGVTASIFYVGIAVRRAIPALLKWPVLGLALLLPLGIGLFLYASYKCLGFGLLLILLANQRSEENVEKNQGAMP